MGDEDYTITFTEGATVGGIDTPTYTFDLSDIQGQDGTSMPMGIDSSFAYSEDKWPSEYKISEMIKQYPALKIQYEKFLEVYNLVKDDYKDEVPF